MNGQGHSDDEILLTRLADLPRLHQLVEAACRGAGADATQTFAMRLAAEEAFTNVLQHGYQGEGRVRVRVSVMRDGIHLEMHDHAPPFAPGDAPGPDVTSDWQTRDAGGLGLHLLQEMVDEVQYRSSPDDGNLLILVKHIPGHDSGKDNEHAN